MTDGQEDCRIAVPQQTWNTAVEGSGVGENAGLPQADSTDAIQEIIDPEAMRARAESGERAGNPLDNQTDASSRSWRTNAMTRRRPDANWRWRRTQEGCHHIFFLPSNPEQAGKILHMWQSSLEIHCPHGEPLPGWHGDWWSQRKDMIRCKWFWILRIPRHTKKKKNDGAAVKDGFNLA